MSILDRVLADTEEPLTSNAWKVNDLIHWFEVDYVDLYCLLLTRDKFGWKSRVLFDGYKNRKPGSIVYLSEGYSANTKLGHFPGGEWWISKNSNIIYVASGEKMYFSGNINSGWKKSALHEPSFASIEELNFEKTDTFLPEWYFK